MRERKLPAAAALCQLKLAAGADQFELTALDAEIQWFGNRIPSYIYDP
jgi:hypothetical protein